MYYKAVVTLSTEQLYWDEAEQAYIGCDPDTYQDHGIVDTITAPTIERLKEDLHRRYDLRDAEVFEGRLEMQFAGEHDYRIPVKERIPFIESFSVHITQVVETEVDASLMLNKKQA